MRQIYTFSSGCLSPRAYTVYYYYSTLADAEDDVYMEVQKSCMTFVQL